MRILVLNWRDIRSPAAGGAEVVTYELARRWVEWGHEVTWFAAGFPGGVGEEQVEGIQIIRRGRQHSVHIDAFRYYRQLPAGQFDVVIDQINTIPFFTPLYVRERKVAFLHQLAREVWLYESRFPVNILGYLLEPWYLRFYRNTPAVAVSESTRQDLLALGFRQVHLVHDGVEYIPPAHVPTPSEKAEKPTLLYVGRVVHSKRVHHLIEALRLVRARVPDVRLWIAGSGKATYVARLKRQAQRLGVSEQVRFWGRVSAVEKMQLMKAAHLVALTSVREGWGLVVVEANAMGTPALVYRVPGLVDSVRHGETGLVCQENTPRELADLAASVLLDPRLQQNFAANALEWSRQFTWERNAQEFLSVLTEVSSE